jgi:hypothetical protein
VPIKTLAMLVGLATMWAVSRLTQSLCTPVALDAAEEPVTP